MGTYNGSEYISEQIKSIDSQLGVSIDLIIRDDNSIDATLNNVKTYEPKNICISYSVADNKKNGPGFNFLNIVLDNKFDQYEFIGFADQDDLWAPNKLISAIQSINSTDYAAYSSNVKTWLPNGSNFVVDKMKFQKRYDYIFEAAGAGSTYLFKREQFLIFQKYISENKDYLDLVSLHDWIIYAFYRINNYKWYFDINSYVRYRQHSSNYLGSSNLYKRIKLIRSGWYLQAVKNNLLFLKLNSNIYRHIIAPTQYSKIILLLNVFNFRRKIIDCVLLLFIIINL